MHDTDTHEMSDHSGGQISSEKGYLSLFSHKTAGSQQHRQDFLQSGTDYAYVKWQDF